MHKPPKITTRLIAHIDRPARRDAPPSSLLVVIQTMAPSGAPDHVRPQWLEITRKSPPCQGRPSLSTTVKVNRHEVSALIAGLQAALAELPSDTTA